MRYAWLKRMRKKGSPLASIIGLPTRRSILIVVAMVATALIGAGAYNHRRLTGTSLLKIPATGMPLQPTAATQFRNLFSRLSVQPEADRVRRRLGQRFLQGGKERVVSTGTLTVGTRQYQIRIARTQGDDGEQVEIALDGGAASLTWSAKQGPLSAGVSPSFAERSLIERLALDSPDQFVLAQLRGAAYYTVARAARPAGTGGLENYNGPVWDVIQVSEPIHSPTAVPLSGWRLYQINVATGLIDKVVCKEQPGQDLTAEIKTWITQGGETLSSHIIWNQGTQTVMELTLNAAVYGPTQ